MKQKGFTVIEFLVVVIIFGILGSIISKGINRAETQCIGGYQFTNEERPVQIIDAEGHGIRCSK